MSAIKISLLWMVMAVGAALYGNYHVSEFMYGVDLRIDTSGKMPFELHLFRLLFELLPLILAVLTIYLQAKIFKQISFIWVMLLAPITTFQFTYSLIRDPSNYSKQMVLLLVLVVNVLLFFAIKKWKETVE